ncbi:hypothetical protein ABIB73_000009 [Bradyrhizobium sp. F1.4.3]|uniref:hypothetical protein n=1 Tax=Bradyrhizobium sp. F1.4.3 TaxID=3156356 RepID=UPI003395C5AD
MVALRWFDDERELSPFLKALEDVRRKATREGWCYAHVQAIIVSIDQYAEAATGNREYFLNKPYSIGGSRKARRHSLRLFKLMRLRQFEAHHWRRSHGTSSWARGIPAIFIRKKDTELKPNCCLRFWPR